MMQAYQIRPFSIDLSDKTAKADVTSLPDFHRAEDMACAYFLMKLAGQTMCINCGVTQTPQWRKAFEIYVKDGKTFLVQDGCESHPREGVQAFLCNACGLKFRNGKYCHLCYQVYGVDSVRMVPESFVACVNCGHANHRACVKDASPEGYQCGKCRDLQ